MPHWLALRLPPSEQAAAQAAGQMRALGWWALQFTPRVLQLEEAVLMEVQASLRLFGGERGLHARLRQELAAWQRDWACGSRAGPGVQPDAGPGRAPDAEPGVVPVAVAAGRPAWLRWPCCGPDDVLGRRPAASPRTPGRHNRTRTRRIHRPPRPPPCSPRCRCTP